ncbi:putative ATP-dependent RNA helicase ddx56 [Perkinsus olseni]|uniref:RNA helicase n=1 Tax=Perkinsus olseni TaxID=32597 RepID=A0A7J6MK96_PEROL|nr:putative ATP-dependent RNA helicase ddx56 [Perkinsus olseni]KAF4676338.1 putative ATP-dependent RNA helicase ddx56 [Perkinsus olseni]
MSSGTEGDLEPPQEEEQQQGELSYAVLDYSINWTDFCEKHGIDRRISKALNKLEFERPALVQSRAIPSVLENKDVLVKARTGCGKTIAYVVPLLQQLLANAPKSGTRHPLTAFVLVPTKELCVQVNQVVNSLLHYAFDVISCDMHTTTHPYRKALPSILVCTPAACLSVLKARKDLGPTIKHLVIDEADLMLSYGYEDDIKGVLGYLDRYQCMLLSATLNDDVETLKGLCLHKPVIVKLEDAESGAAGGEGHLKQFYLPLRPDEKYLVVYGLLKLKLLVGKTLIFAKDIDSAYRYKLLLDKFSMGSVAVLNYELPFLSRNQIIESFNMNAIDVLIATNQAVSGSGAEEQAIHRGLDFVDVKAVLNADMPETAREYVHRVGRTARGGANGTALTLVDDFEQWQEVLAEIEEAGVEIEALPLDIAELASLKYRVEDVSHSITKKAVAVLRQSELMREVLHSDKMKQQLQENTEDAKALRKSLRQNNAKVAGSTIKKNLKDLPEYLVPQSFLNSLDADGDESNPVKLAALGKGSSAEEKKGKGVKRKMSSDPLKTFESARKRLLTGSMRDRMLRKEPSNVGVNVESLAPISGRKLWKIRHRKHVGGHSDRAGQPKVNSLAMKKRRKKFQLGGRS